jgi:hypothetical protein
VTHHDCFHELNDLCEELLWLLVVDTVQLILNGSLQRTVIDVWNLYFREQIGNDAHEQWQIVLQELWHVGVSHGSDQHHIFSQRRLLSSQRTSHHQHTLDGSHTEIVMVLFTQLF